MRRVPLAETEYALALLAATHADFYRSRTGQLLIKPHTVSIPRSTRSLDIELQATMFRLVGVVESYVDTINRILVEFKVTDRNPFLDTLLVEALEKAGNSWDERKRSFLEYHQIALGACDGWSEMDSFILVRNAIAHGLGDLTVRQRNSKSIARLKAVNVSVVDGKIVYSPTMLERCHSAARRFILSLDAKVSTTIT